MKAGRSGTIALAMVKNSVVFIGIHLVFQLFTKGDYLKNLLTEQINL
jgi:hypothetical protein